MKRTTLAALAVACVAASALTGSAFSRGTAPTLRGVVGPGYTISLKKAGKRESTFSSSSSMRGWITGRNATCAPEFGADDFLELVQGPVEVVVDNRVVELRLECELALGDVQTLVDLALALGRAGTKPPFELLRARGGDEDDNAVLHAVAHGERAARLDLEQRRGAVGDDPAQLGPKRARAVALAPRQLDVLEEAALGEAPIELLFRDEPVVAPVVLAGPPRARGRGDGQLQLRHPLRQAPRERAFPLAGCAGDDEDRPSG